ncbi:hypothetical protein DTO013E5_8541 [Penicillium roqueforti]|uniref:uncharacterized protein n=1 Tax=Penicillium roqueforti TaxID=5082 RepID=UPI0019093C0F|nr:uncharacterized protein LCP9604111_4744 [Penicillium roqueforti]KAF9249028.1 hypothetical protein LCP9604111_4744 [Penicillium roqueforti]KAI1832148.1 hypothetical protein CBS147337_7220 [Penicillium roqueforti]KAI2704648.1 hypothetical protein CBS147332_7302 [Penicillium roqueforti]KAI2713901.1 hypothetical protein CBS147318_7179 [Penicillium roqueforti]KAI2718525.1 hypothetical protein CBS147354_6540 [Penicillium roqueforti]
MANGAEVVGKVPNPNAGQPHFTTASEVATMEFVRNILGTPAPCVLAWSSKAGENAVGAEYIIMEKVGRIQLGHAWDKMGIEDRFEICSDAMKEGESCQFLKGRMPDYLVMGVGACRADGQVTTMSNKYRAIALMPNSLILPLGHRQVEIKLIMEWYRLILTADHGMMPFNIVAQWVSERCTRKILQDRRILNPNQIILHLQIC